MNKFIGFTRRNILIYFKDKSAVFFSMLTPIIIFVMYILFLKGTFVNSLNNSAEAIKDFISAKDIDSLANGFLLCGILGSALITIPYNCLLTIVYDRERKVDSDILSTPVRRTQIIISYYISAAICAFVMSAVILTTGLIILNTAGNMYFTSGDVAMMYLITLLGAMSSTALFMVIVMFFKSSASAGAFMGILSAAAGFVIGAYIPLSGFSDKIRNICFLFPATSITSLIRRFLLSGILTNIDKDLGGIDNGLFRQSVEQNFDFGVSLFGNSLTTAQTCYYVIAVTAVFAVAIGIIYPRIYKRN